MYQAHLDQDIFAAARVLDSLHRGVGSWVRLVMIFLGTIALAVLATRPFMSWSNIATGMALIVSAISVGFLMVERYCHGVVNANTALTPDAATILANVTQFPAFLDKLLKHPRVQYLTLKLLLDPKWLRSEKPISRDQVLLAAREAARDRRVDLGDLLLIALSESPEALASLERQHLDRDDVVTLISWEAEQEAGRAAGQSGLDPDHLILTGGFAKDWAAGYTLLLDRYSQDLTAYFSSKKSRLHIIGHQRIVDEIGRNLVKSAKSNVLLVGDPGVGKKTAVLGFAQAVYQGKSLPGLSWKHVKMVDLAHLVAGADPEDVEVRLLTVLNEAARSGNVILFLDDIEMILGGTTDSRQRSTGRVSGIVDSSATLARFLESSSIQIIATTTYDAYHQTIEKNPLLATQFEKVEVGEPTLAETELITLQAAVGIENEYRVLVPLATVKEVVKLAERYLHDRPFPEKALDLLEEVAVYVSRQTRERIVLPTHVQEIVHRKTDIPVAEASGEERGVLMNLEDTLHQRVVNQTEAISAVSDALRRARAGLKEKNKPIGTFLFLGPTGVGKTETAKAVAEAYFGSERNMIRLDMNEFADVANAERLQEQLTTRAKEDPYTLVLFDEIEKANSKIMNLLLRLLDEGKMADLSGKSVDMTNMIFIATSNAGAEQIREAIKGKTEFATVYETLRQELLDYLQKEHVFNPEFLNRFDAVVLFQPLTLSQIAEVVELMMNRLNRQLQEQGVQVKLDPAAVEKLAQVGYDPVFGARALRRTLQERVENVVAKRILAGQIQQGTTVTLSPSDI